METPDQRQVPEAQEESTEAGAPWGYRLVKWGWSQGPGFDWAELESLGQIRGSSPHLQRCHVCVCTF